MDIGNRHAGFLAEEIGKARTVQHACHADHFFRVEPGELLQRPDHRVERIGDTDHECVRAVGLQALADRFHDLQVDAEQIIAAHAGLAGNTRCHDADICILDVGIIVRALQAD